MFIDDTERTGSVTRARVILEERDTNVDSSDVGTFVLMSLWDGMGDWDEVIDHGDGVFEVICR